ncbi:MAG: thermostable hemolysin [Patescibacteria group bacterium]
MDFFAKDQLNFSELRLNLQIRVIYALEQLVGYAITYSHDFNEALLLMERLEEKIEQLDPKLIDVDTFRDNLRLNRASVYRRLGKHKKAEGLLSEDQHEVHYPQNLIHRYVYVCELARAKRDREQIRLCSDNLLLLIGGINGQGKFANFFQQLFIDLSAAEKNEITVRIQKEYLLCLLELDQLPEYESKKISWSESWRENMASQPADLAILEGDLLLKEAGKSGTADDSADRKYQGAIGLYQENNLDFCATEAVIRYLNKFKEKFPREKLEELFLRHWQIVEKNIGQTVMQVFAAEHQETARVSSVLFEIAELIKFLYGTEGSNKEKTLQQALISLGKKNLTAAKEKIILQNDDNPEDQYRKLSEAFGAKGLLAISKDEGGMWKKEYSARAEKDDFDWRYLLDLPEIQAKIAEADRTQKMTELKFVFTNTKCTDAAMHLVFLPNEPGRISIVDRGSRLGFSDAEKQLMLPEKFPPKRIQTGVTTTVDRDYQQIQRAIAMFYLERIPRFQITAAENIVYAWTEEDGQKKVLGGLSANILENEINHAAGEHLSYPEIFGGENFWETLKTEVDKQLQAGSLSPIWQEAFQQKGEVKREQCAEIGGLAARDGTIAPAIFLQTTKFCLEKKRPWMIMIRNARVERLFKLIGIEAVDLGYANIQDKKVRAELCQSGWDTAGLTAWEADYFNRELNPRMVILNTQQAQNAILAFFQKRNRPLK